MESAVKRNGECLAFHRLITNVYLTPICHLVFLVYLITILILFNVLLILLTRVNKLCRYCYRLVRILSYNVTF